MLVRILWRGFASAQHDVKAEAKRPIGDGVLQIETRDHALARLFVGHRIEDGIEWKQAVAREVHLRHQARKEGVAKHREVNVVRAPRIVMIAPRVGTRLHGDKAVVALVVGNGTPCPGEIRIERRRMLVDVVDVAAASIRLPDFHQGIGNRALVFVEHMAVHDDAFAQRFALVLPGEVGIAFLHGAVAIDRPGQFGKRLRHHDQGFRRRPLHRAAIARREMLGKSTQALFWKNQRHPRSFSIGAQVTRSSASDTPWPTPTHMVASPSLPPLSSRPCATVSAKRAPDMPSGCPSAIAPPCGLTCSASSASPNCRRQASDCDAKASLISIKLKSLIFNPSRSMSLRVAGTGPMPMMRGGTPADAMPSTRARAFRPCAFTASAEARIMAAAPSLTPDALPAVTVPGLRNGVLSLASASRVVSGRGCSSVSTTMVAALPPAALPPGTSTLTISSAK